MGKTLSSRVQNLSRQVPSSTVPIIYGSGLPGVPLVCVHSLPNAKQPRLTFSREQRPHHARDAAVVRALRGRQQQQLRRRRRRPLRQWRRRRPRGRRRRGRTVVVRRRRRQLRRWLHAAPLRMMDDSAESPHSRERHCQAVMLALNTGWYLYSRTRFC